MSVRLVSTVMLRNRVGLTFAECRVQNTLFAPRTNDAMTTFAMRPSPIEGRMII